MHHYLCYVLLSKQRLMFFFNQLENKFISQQGEFLTEVLPPNQLYLKTLPHSVMLRDIFECLSFYQ